MAMAELDNALSQLATDSAATKGSGDSINDYPLQEKGLIRELPVCPVEKYRQPKPESYIVEKDASGSLNVRCRIHGTRANLTVIPQDPYQQQMLQKAIEVDRERKQTSEIVFALLIGFAPLLLFLAARLLLGKSFIKKRILIFRIMFSIIYGLVVTFLALLFFTIRQHLESFLLLSAVTSTISFISISSSLKSPDKEKNTAISS